MNIFLREISRLKIAFKYHFRRRTAKTPIFVLSGGRDGSNLLVSYLNSISGVCVHGEILSELHAYGIRKRFISKRAVIRHIRHWINVGSGPFGGAKIFFRDLKLRRLTLTELCRQFPTAKWLVLYRKNILDQYLSYLVASKTKVWIKTTPENVINLPKIRLKPQEMLMVCDRVRENYGHAYLHFKTLGPKRSLWISYEELVEDPQGLFDGKIFDFLDLESQEVRTNLLRQNSRSYDQIISNYEEVKEFIRNTDFSQTYGAAL